MNPIFVKRKDLPKMVGLAYSTISKLEKDDKFPARKQLTDCRVAWLYSELLEWANSRKNHNNSELEVLRKD